MELTSMFKRMDVDQNNDTRTLKLLYYICINDQDQDLEITSLNVSPTRIGQRKFNDGVIHRSGL